MVIFGCTTNRADPCGEAAPGGVLGGPGYDEGVQFEETPAVSREDLERIFATGSADDIAHALISAAFHEPDWRLVQEWCLRFADHGDPNVRRVAVTALGHLARVHHALDLERILPVLAKKADEVELAGTVEDTLDDIRRFIPLH